MVSWALDAGVLLERDARMSIAKVVRAPHQQPRSRYPDTETMSRMFAPNVDVAPVGMALVYLSLCAQLDVPELSHIPCVAAIANKHAHLFVAWLLHDAKPPELYDDCDGCFVASSETVRGRCPCDITVSIRRLQPQRLHHHGNGSAYEHRVIVRVHSASGGRDTIVSEWREHPHGSYDSLICPDDTRDTRDTRKLPVGMRNAMLLEAYDMMDRLGG
jgi:hypothetical protein